MTTVRDVCSAGLSLELACGFYAGHRSDHWCRVDGHQIRWVNHGNSRQSAQIRLAALTHPGGTECYDWVGAVNESGYGVYSYGPASDRRTTTANRAVLALATPVANASELQAAHRCHRRICINRDHLYWASPQQNTIDRVLGDFMELRPHGGTGYAGYVSQAEVAHHAGVSVTTVSKVVRGLHVGHSHRMRVLRAIEELGYEKKPGCGRPRQSEAA